MSAMIALLPPRIAKFRPSPVYPIARSKPFAESGGGRYAHRVRSASLHTCLGKSHIAVHLWCGMVICIGGRNRGSRFVEEPTGRAICATCEGRAIGAGQLGAREIAGRAVMFSPRHVAATMSAENSVGESNA